MQTVLLLHISAKKNGMTSRILVCKLLLKGKKSYMPYSSKKLLLSSADFLQCDTINSSCLAVSLNKKSTLSTNIYIMPISHISNKENSLRSGAIKHCYFSGKESRHISEQFKVSNVA